MGPRDSTTLILGQIPAERLCFHGSARLGLHKARYSDNTASIQTTQWMIDQYPPNIQTWISRRGGTAAMPELDRYWILSAHDLWKMGYRKCED